VPSAVVSASHNPFHDNGIKLFAAGGRKLGDELQARMEAELAAAAAVGGGGSNEGEVPAPPTGTGVGRLSADTDGQRRYAQGLVSSLEGRRLDGLSVVVDCANGAAYQVAPEVLARLGARVQVLFDHPDGQNINDGCGSTSPTRLRQAVVEAGADAGLALDGDADRVIAVDHRGELVDGDQMLALCALDRRSSGRLPGDTVVVTVMANLGLRLTMAEHGITVVETPVGDRWVLEALEAGGWALGGEQSGHLVFRDLATTGDGILTSLQVLDVMVRTGRRLADVAGVMARLPQVLGQVRVAPGASLDSAPELALEVKTVEAELGDRGRVLVRRSGTEPVIRVMVEAPTLEQAQAACASLCSAVTRLLGTATEDSGAASDGSGHGR
jgi:phosphoglucosamine mutase